MTRTWHINKKQLQKTAAILFAMALLFGLFAFAHWFGALMALIAAVAGVHSLIVAQNTKPVLTIGPEGLRYARFSERTVPWDRIDEVAVVRGMQRGAAWGKVVYRPQPQMDEINFSLKDYEGYSGALRNALRSIRTQFGAPGVQLYVVHLDGPTADDIASAIHAHWKGQIQDLTPRDGRFEKIAWTGTPPKVE